MIHLHVAFGGPILYAHEGDDLYEKPSHPHNVFWHQAQAANKLYDMGYTAKIEAAGGTVLSGMCFYQSYAREIAEAKGWKRLATNSAKLVNILGGYGYVPMLASMEKCVEAARTGRLL